MNLCRNYCNSDCSSKHSDDGVRDSDDDGDGDGGVHSRMDPNLDSNKGYRKDHNIPNDCNNMDDSTTTMMDTTNYSPNIYLHPNSLDCRYTNTYWCNSRRSNLYLPQEHQSV